MRTEEESALAANGVLGQRNATVHRVFSDFDGDSSKWVCGEAGGQQPIVGCGFANYNSRFCCYNCKKGKSGYRKKANETPYPHMSWTCGCKGKYDFANWAVKNDASGLDEAKPHCGNCFEEVGEFDPEFGFNRGHISDKKIYLGRFSGSRKMKGEYVRKKKVMMYTG